VDPSSLLVRVSPLLLIPGLLSVSLCSSLLLFLSLQLVLVLVLLVPPVRLTLVAVVVPLPLGSFITRLPR
jgi:hypothetical protein